MWTPRVGVVIALGLVACGSDEPQRTTMFGGDRPVELETPEPLEDGKRYPLYLVLHGFGATGFIQTAYFGLSDLPGEGKAFVLAPDGTPSSADGRQFWNADPACCDFAGQNPDDVAYLGGLLDEVIDMWPIDKNQVFVIGHSNGGFMSYRMACERADVIAAIAPLAGLAASNAAACTPSEPVAVLHMHGTIDTTVPYQGGGNGIGTIGADGSVMQWATHNGCASTRTAGGMLDVSNGVAGAETQVYEADGCPADGEITLWEMRDVGHIPTWTSQFTPELIAWLTAHARS